MKRALSVVPFLAGILVGAGVSVSLIGPDTVDTSSAGSSQPISIDLTGMSDLANHARRKQAMDDFDRQLAQLVEQLEGIVQLEQPADWLGPREASATSLARLRSLESIPLLVEHLGFEVPTARIITKHFHIEPYPCAHAIQKMGPSAIQPMIAAIVTRKTPLTETEVKVASYVLYSLCENSTEKAAAVVWTAEQGSTNRQQLHAIHMYIQHFMGLRKEAGRVNPEPKT